MSDADETNDLVRVARSIAPTAAKRLLVLAREVAEQRRRATGARDCAGDTEEVVGVAKQLVGTDDATR